MQKSAYEKRPGNVQFVDPAFKNKDCNSLEMRKEEEWFGALWSGKHWNEAIHYLGMRIR